MKLFLGLSLLAATAIAADTCASSGYDKSSPASYLTDTTATTPLTCSALCKKDAKCKSFVVGGGICNLYSAAVAGNFAIDNAGTAKPTRSPYYFYDVNCTITTASPPRAFDATKPICNLMGFDKGNPAPFWNDAVSQTPEQCAAGCKLKAGCTAFALVDNTFTHRATNCWYYTSLTDNFVYNTISSNGGEDYYFYQMSCFASSASTAAAATSTAKTISSTSSPAAAVPTTTTTARSSTTSTAVVAPPAASLICGSTGYDKGSPAAYAGSSGATLASCKASCSADATCKAYVYGTTGECLLYTAVFANNFAASASSPYSFYDAACSSSAPFCSSTTLRTSARTSTSTTAAAAATSTSAKVCSFKGFEIDSADTSIVGSKFKPAAGCKSFCQGKSALSYEQYYDYCICFSKSVAAVATASASSTVAFNDISC